MNKIDSYNPTAHRQDVLALFKSRPDIFPANEILQITEQSKFSSTSDHYKIVAKSGKDIAGYGGVVFDLQQKIWNLDWFAVGKQFHRQGIGSLLMKSIMGWLQKQKVTQLQVETCSCDGEAPARAFYTNMGFVPIKTENDGYGIGHSKITFLKQLY